MPTFNENVVVDGVQDIQQLRVQGHTTQNQSLQTWENSSGNALGQVTGDGNLIVGSTTINTQMTKDGRMIAGDDLGVATPDALLEVHRAETSITRPTRGVHSLGQLTGALTNLVQWMVGELELRGSSAINALHTALRIRASNLNTGTPGSNAELRGADVEVINEVGAGSGALPKATGLQASVTNATGKTITDAAALRLRVNNAGTITNPYSIYAEGPGVVHFEDYLEVKRPAAIPGTPPTDFVRLYPKVDGKLYYKDAAGLEYLIGGPASNLAATRPPNVTDDVTAGWVPGSMWIDLPAANAYVCLGNTTGNAVWRRTTDASVTNDRRWWAVTASNNTYTADGTAAPTATAATAANDVDSVYVNHASAATAGTIVGIISSTFNLVRPGYNPTLTALIRTGSDITNLRLFIGLFAAAPTNADNPPNNSITFRFSTVAADGGWRGICRDAAAQTVSAQIGPALVANTRYLLRIRKQGTSVFFSVNNGPETAVNTTLPADATEMGYGIRAITTTATAKNLKISRLQCDFN